MAFFQFALGAFERAERSAGAHCWFGQLAGRTVRLRCAGGYLLDQIVPALAHRQCPPADSDLTVFMWDNRSTDTQLPCLMESFIKAIKHRIWETLDPRHELRHLNDERFRAVYRLGPSVDILSLYDRETSQAIYWMEDATLLPYWETTSPLQTILNWWAESRNLQYVHAAAVGFPEGALLLTGPGGSGKSSTALSCLDADLGYLADDYCLVSADPARVFSLYCMAKLVGEDDFERFPRLADWVENPQRGSEDKAVLNLHRRRPEKLIEEAPILAVVVPRVCRGTVDSRLVPLKGAQALLALAPSTLFQLAGTHQDCLSRLTRLLRQVPCYSLELGSDVSQLPALLKGLLASRVPH